MIDTEKTGKRVKIDNNDNKIKQGLINLNEHIKKDEFQIKLQHLNNIETIKIEQLIENTKLYLQKTNTILA